VTGQKMVIASRKKATDKKWSSLREKKPKRWRNDPHPRGIRSAVTSEFHRAGISQIDADLKISHPG
jgi:hypothetical protein